MKVLIVEDELLIALVYKQVLEKNGYDVIATVTNTTDAWVAIEKNTPDIILLDVCLKGHENGIDWTRIIRTKTNIPVIFTTGNSLQKTIDETKGINNCVVLSKPINTDTLLLNIQKLTAK